MKVTVKQLKGGECTIEVQPSTSISELKRQVAQHLKIPVKEQKLLFLGRTLVDNQTLQSYPTIKEGSKLNLVIQKPKTLADVAYKSFKKAGVPDAEAKTASQKLEGVLREKIYQMSWDDIERLSGDILRITGRVKKERV